MAVVRLWVAAIVVWELGAWLLVATGVPLAQSKLPYPHLVLLAAAGNAPLLGSAVASTGETALAGLLVGTVLGFGIALVMTLARWLEDAVFPYIVAAQMIPTLALGPIILSSVKDPTVTRVLVAAYIAFFAISLASIKGLKSASPTSLDLLASYDANRAQVYTKLRIPGSLPFFFAGLKVAAPLSVVGAVVVELAGAKAGLGFLLLTTQYYGPSYANLFWATIVATMLLGYAFAWTAGRLEPVISSWQPEFRGQAAARQP
jgi:NitT/TauT family transport system permease protein